MGKSHPHNLAFFCAIVLAIVLGPPPAAADGVRLDGLIAGGGVVTKKITSYRERRFINMVPQRTDFSCGAASIATILKYAYGRDTTEEEVLEDMFRVADKETVLQVGFSLLDMKRYVETLNMQGVGLKVEPENLDKIEVPTIVLLDIKGYKHFVVLKTVREGKAYVADPALGNNVMELDEFVAAWNGVVFAVIADGYQQDTVLADPPPQDSAQRLLGMRSPVVDAQMLDFGTANANLF